MGVREGGSYVVDKSGKETLVHRTHQDDPSRVIEVDPAPDVMSAPAAPEPEPEAGAEASAAGRRRGADSKPQE